jgi:hypothetical protein
MTKNSKNVPDSVAKAMAELQAAKDAAAAMDPVAVAEAKLKKALAELEESKAAHKAAMKAVKHEPKEPKLPKEEKVKPPLVKTLKCVFPECEHHQLAAGYCSSHYRQHNRGKEMLPLRPYRELVRLPMVIRVDVETMAALKDRVEGKTARSMYEATRQAVEAGVAVWAKEKEKAEKKAAAK